MGSVFPATDVTCLVGDVLLDHVGYTMPSKPEFMPDCGVCNVADHFMVSHAKTETEHSAVPPHSEYLEVVGNLLLYSDSNPTAAPLLMLHM